VPNVLLMLAGVAVLGMWALARTRAGRHRDARIDLRDGMRALARGDTGNRIQLTPGRGGDGLVDEFNRMADCVARRHRDLDLAREEGALLIKEMIRSREHHRATLEEKVRERTADLQKAYEGLKKIDELKDSFLSSVSHELRTPLSSIRSFSEILLNDDGDLETRREFLGIINQESERLTRLINNVLDISKIESGEVDWRLVPLSLARVCSTAIAPLRVLADEKKQTLVLGIADDLPAVMADQDRLIQVILNLVSNAIKFTPEGGEIRVIAERMGAVESGVPALVRVAVTDDGIGIPPGELDNIFEKFKQVGDPLTGKPSGTGLGLPICREIIRHLGGTLWAESAPGKGSRFLFTLSLAGDPGGAVAHTGVSPVDQRTLRAGPATGAAPAAPAAPVNAAGTSGALVVCADAGRRLLLLDELRDLGLQARGSAGPEEAIETCRDAPPALIVLDIPGPAMRRFADMDLLRGVPSLSQVPILVVSDSLSHEESMAAGAAGHLGRPIVPSDLHAKVQTLLGTRRRLVAVADDDAGTVGVLSEFLALRGYEVLTASDGEEALRIARENPIELLVLDLNMPLKSGWKVLEMLRSEARTRSLPVIVLTGMDAENDRARALALGAVDLLEKGNGLGRLAAEIDLLVQRSV
jgi:signal transduction histidine kinase/CheY-like chemotaxis protein